MPRSQPGIAFAGLDRVAAAGMRFGCVLADAGYGLSAVFRQGLSARGLRWAIGLPHHLKVYPTDVALLPPPATGRASGTPPIPCPARPRRCWHKSHGGR
jgi:SRSO17 transposase